MAQTRSRILEAAQQLLPDAAEVPVDTIAEQAGVSVQTLYTHFGSKRGLLIAVIDAAQRDVGTYADFERVWQSPDGETALRRMLEATVRIWHEAWPIVEFAERVRRTDPEIRGCLQQIDSYRRSNLSSITTRIADEGRLRKGLDAAQAAELVFALSLPAVYEDLCRIRGWTWERAAGAVVEVAVAAVVDAGAAAVTTPPADWSSVLKPADVIARVSG